MDLSIPVRFCWCLLWFILCSTKLQCPTSCLQLVIVLNGLQVLLEFETTDQPWSFLHGRWKITVQVQLFRMQQGLKAMAVCTYGGSKLVGASDPRIRTHIRGQLWTNSLPLFQTCGEERNGWLPSIPKHPGSVKESRGSPPQIEQLMVGSLPSHTSPPVPTGAAFKRNDTQPLTQPLGAHRCPLS